jgi:3-methylfumaryl-CoA hydratase
MTERPSLDDWIGCREAFEPDVLTRRLCREYAATFGDLLAPVPAAAPGLHWCLAPAVADTGELGPDGHPAKGGFLPPIPLPRRMWASGSLEFLDPLRPGDTVHKTSTVKDIAWKTGRSGKLCIVTLATDYATGRGIAIREDQHIVYREASKAPTTARAPEAAELEFDVERRAEITLPLLFRYSALTFNGHRIHYDLRYAQEVEGYPDLVIHGPLQATLLLNLAASAKSTLPKHFEFRAVSPATGPQTLRFGAVAGGKGCDLKVVSAANIVTMTASARW